MSKEARNKFYSLLRWSEKYTKTDMVYFTKSASWLFFGRSVLMGLSFVSTLVFANFVNTNTYSTYKYILSVISILMVFTLRGMGTSVVRSVARGFENTYKLALKTKIKWGVIGSSLAILFGVYYIINGNPEFAIAFFVSALFLPILSVFNIYNSILIGKKLFRYATTSDIWVEFVFFVSLIIIVLITDNIVFILLPYLFAHSMLQYIVLKRITNKLDLNNKTDVEAVVYGKKLSILKGLDIVSSNINSILLFQLIDPMSLAVFLFAIAPVEQIRSLIKLAEPIFLPKLSKDNWQISSFKFFAKKIAGFVALLVLVMLIYISFAPYFYQYIFPRYLEAIPYSRFYAITLIFTGLNIFLITLIKAKKNTKSLFLTTYINIALIFLVKMPLIILFQINGLIISIFIEKLITTVYLLFSIFKPNNLSLKSDINIEEEKGILQKI